MTSLARRRKLGATDLSIHPIVFGAWAIGGWWWGGQDEAEALDALDAAIALGQAIDTAPIYGLGRSEELVGRALRGRRAPSPRPIVMTKAGLRWDDARGQHTFDAVAPDGTNVRTYRNSRPDSIRLECERSLARLGIESIDLYQLHWPDPTTPIGETMGALLDLQREGKIRAIGVSNFAPELMDAARARLGGVPLASDQVPYSLIRRDVERDVLPYCRTNGVGVLGYSPLGQGLLTGTVGASRSFAGDDMRAKKLLFAADSRARINAALDAAARPIAERRGASVAQVVLAWTIAQPGVTAAIAGARRRAQAEENAAAAEIELAADELAAIGRAFSAYAPSRLRRAVLGGRALVGRLLRGQPPS